MSRKTFCDVCGEETPTSVTGDRVKDSTVLNGMTVNVEVMCGLGRGSWNSGDLCKPCLFQALDRFDPRPRAGA